MEILHTYDYIISVENLLFAWQEFVKDKKNKKDVQLFQPRLMEHVFELHSSLKNKTYKHSAYTHFKINDPKPRDIHKALVVDRLVHHAIYRVLMPFFDKKFIYDSYSCRKNKGTHKALQRFQVYGRKVSKNNTKTCWVLKCDIKKFFANINHTILKDILEKHIQNKNILWLLSNVIDSFHTDKCKHSKPISWDELAVGLPLGNLTSQLLVNVYMNKFDQYIKHILKVTYYIRYADDFVFFSEDKNYLVSILSKMQEFLRQNLKLEMHPNKVFIKTLSNGVDFLGWVHFSHHRVLRTASKKRMFRNLEGSGYKEESIQSYLGMLSHGNGYELGQKILALIRI